MRADSEAFRGIWYDIINIASSISPRAGYVELFEGVPLSLDELSEEFRIDRLLLGEAIESFRREGRLGLDASGSMYLTNWDRYQSIPLGTESGQLKATQAEARRIRGELKFVRRHRDLALVDTNTGQVIGQGKDTDAKVESTAKD